MKCLTTYRDKRTWCDARKESRSIIVRCSVRGLGCCRWLDDEPERVDVSKIQSDRYGSTDQYRWKRKNVRCHSFDLHLNNKSIDEYSRSSTFPMVFSFEQTNFTWMVHQNESTYTSLLVNSSPIGMFYSRLLCLSFISFTIFTTTFNTSSFVSDSTDLHWTKSIALRKNQTIIDKRRRVWRLFYGTISNHHYISILTGLINLKIFIDNVQFKHCCDLRQFYLSSSKMINRNQNWSNFIFFLHDELFTRFDQLLFCY